MHHTDLGWVIIGNVCLGNVRRSSTVSSFKTCVLPTPLPCQERLCCKGTQHFFTQSDNKTFHFWDDYVCTAVFDVTTKDNDLAVTKEDKKFPKSMSSGVAWGGARGTVALGATFGWAQFRASECHPWLCPPNFDLLYPYASAAMFNLRLAPGAL